VIGEVQNRAAPDWRLEKKLAYVTRARDVERGGEGTWSDSAADVLVNNAGRCMSRRGGINEEEWEGDDGHVKGRFLMSRAVLPEFRNARGSHREYRVGAWTAPAQISRILSVERRSEMLTKAMAVVHGHGNIRANASAFDRETELVKGLFDASDRAGAAEGRIALIPLGASGSLRCGGMRYPGSEESSCYRGGDSTGWRAYAY